MQSLLQFRKELNKNAQKEEFFRTELEQRTTFENVQHTKMK